MTPRNPSVQGFVYAQGDNLRKALYEPDRRSFPQILSAWVVYEGSGEEEFLRKTGLDALLTKDEFLEIEFGTKIPSVRLARMMALHLPGGILRKDEEPPASLPQLYGFQSRAAFWRESLSNAGKPVMDIADDKLQAFSIRVLDSLKGPAPEEGDAPVVEPSLPAGPAMRDHILNHLATFSTAEKSPEEIEELLLAQYREHPEDTVQGLKNMMVSSDYTYSEKELREWLDALAPAKQPSPAGQALCFLRQSRGLTQKALARLSGVTTLSIQKWELDKAPIPRAKLEVLSKCLNLSAEEAARFILLARPNIIQGVGVEWLENQIKDGNWEYINFPALDYTWLLAQPKDKQAGLLLKAYRERKGLSQKTLGNAFRVTDGMVTLLEAGRVPISLLRIGTIAQHLVLSPDQVERFILTARPDIVQHAGNVWLKAQIAKENWNHIIFPALNDEWLAAQPQEKQAGLLLKAYRERKGMMQKVLAALIGVTNQSISLCESRFSPVAVKNIDSIARALELSEHEKDRLTETIEISREARRMINAQTKLGANILAKSISPELLPSSSDRER